MSSRVSDKFRSVSRPIDKPLRICVSDVFKGMGSGFSVTGKIASGCVQIGDRVIVMPAAEYALVKGRNDILYGLKSQCIVLGLLLRSSYNNKELEAFLDIFGNIVHLHLSLTFLNEARRTDKVCI